MTAKNMIPFDVASCPAADFDGPDAAVQIVFVR